MNAGVLYVVATPIGNLGDITHRAEQVMATVAVIAAEDTRHTGRLLQHLQITTPTVALHEHNEKDMAPQLVDRIKHGEDIALVSDAGTPLVSDPGFQLVRLARDSGIKVIPVPGASALLAALAASGLPSDRFVFEGFLPAKSTARQKHLESLATETRTLIFYEAPHRLLETLRDMASVFGADRYVVLARELTKTFETIHGDRVIALLAWAQADPHQQKGEMVVLVHGYEAIQGDAAEQEGRRILKLLLGDLPLSQASALAAKIAGVNKKPLYQYGLSLSDKTTDKGK